MMIQDSIWSFIENLEDCTFDAKWSFAFITIQTTLMTISNILGVNWIRLSKDDRYLLNQFQHCFKYYVGSVLGCFLFFIFKRMAMPWVNALSGICVASAATPIANSKMTLMYSMSCYLSFFRKKLNWFIHPMINIYGHTNTWFFIDFQ